MDDRSIAVFDSGYGGLTFLNQARQLMPGENFIYYGDNKNAPYGNKPEEEIKKLADGVFGFFSRLPVKAAVVACNTVTAECIDYLRGKYDFKIFGMEPALKPAEEALNGKKYLVIGTRATLESQRFLQLISRFPNAEPLVAADLAGEIERYIFEPEKINFDKYFQGIDKSRYGGVVLGCTHYIFVKDKIAELYPDWKIFDGNLGTAKNLKNYIEKTGLKNDEKIGSVHFVGECILRNQVVFSNFVNKYSH